jgi:hypothetical protein
VSLTVAPAALAASHRTSAEIDIHGQVVGTNGQPITGASITLVAWPPHRVLDNLRPGQPVPWKVLGTVVSGQTGSYSLASEPLSAIRSVVESDFVNLELLASTATSFGDFGFPVRVIRKVHGTLLASFTGKMTPAFPKTVNFRLSPAHHKVPSTSPGGTCKAQSTYLHSLGKQQVVIGESWSKISGVKMGFTYLTGQSSQLGYGISSTGSKGSWSAGGTAASSKSAEQDFPTFYNAVSHHYLTVLKYGYYQIIPVTCVLYYKALEDEFVGGSIEKSTGSIKADNCAEYQGAGAGVVLNKNAAYTYETGVNITDIIGIDLSSQTGYDTQTTISFHVTRGTHWLCGDTTYPADYPQRAQWGLPRR